jgi:hypothetical protein
MRIGRTAKWLTWSVMALGVTLISPAPVAAHCDGLDGPVVKAAQQALDTRNPTLALMWVQANDEPEIRMAFEQTLAVRVLSPQAKELADRFPITPGVSPDLTVRLCGAHAEAAATSPSFHQPAEGHRQSRSRPRQPRPGC